MRYFARIFTRCKYSLEDIDGFIFSVFLSIQARFHLFLPHEKRIPKIRIESRQAEELKNSRVMVQIDHWPRLSRYPHVRIIHIPLTPYLMAFF